jgi:hypothetical protein
MNACDYETIVYKHDFQKDSMNKVLGIVKGFIQRKGLILVGGMAIDIALRSKGDGKHLYGDNVLPDYDFYTSDWHKDAYDLGTILAKDFSGVSVINAFHVSTMRVRVDFREAADLSYIPETLLKSLPTIKHMGFNVIHPHYQMIDQHRALSLPYENPPLETVYGRWKNDITRYDLLTKEFPLFKESFLPQKSVEYTIQHKELAGHCLSGYTSLLYWLNEAKTDGFKCDSSWHCSFRDDGKSICVILPETASVCILVDDYDDAIKVFGKDADSVKRFRQVVDKINERSEIINGDLTYTIINNYGDKRSAHKTTNYHVSNLQEVMGYLLTMGILYKNQFAINAYLVAQELLYYAADKYKPGNKFSKYLPSTETYGRANIYPAILVSKQNVDAVLNKTPRTLITPKNAYPTKERPEVKQELYQFDPTKEVLFQFDGSEI